MVGDIVPSDPSWLDGAWLVIGRDTTAYVYYSFQILAITSLPAGFLRPVTTRKVSGKMEMYRD